MPRMIDRLVVFTLAAVLTGCGGSTGQDGAAVAPPATTSGEPTTTFTETTTAAPASGVSTLNKKFWYAGWIVELGQVSVAGTQVEIVARFENGHAESRAFEPRLLLTSGGGNFEPTSSTELPEVPGGSSQTGTVVYEVDAGFSLSDAVLTIGSPERNQAVVPLGGSGEAKTHEPRPITATGEMSMTFNRYRGTGSTGVVKVNLTGGEVRGDRPDKGQQADNGKLIIVLEHTVDWKVDDSHQFDWWDDYIYLELPNATLVQAEYLQETLDEDTTASGLKAYFIVPEPAAGGYKFIYRTSKRQIEIPFEVQ